MRAVASVPRAWKLERAEKRDKANTFRRDGGTAGRWDGGAACQTGWAAGRMQGWSGLIETMGRTINLAPQKQEQSDPSQSLTMG